MPIYKYYTGAHAAFFEACYADWPTPVLEWLCEDLPSIADMLGYEKRDGWVTMIDRDSHEWKEIVCKAFAENLPDYCFSCGTIIGWLPGGQLREGCHLCIDSIPTLYGGIETRPLLRMMLVMERGTNHDYFSDFIEYLLLCHIVWREQNTKLARISTTEQEVKPDKPKSLLEKLR